jgi:Right handed beta helix region
MFKSKFILRMFVFALFIIGFQLSAQAQATRTWVSGVGDDVNPCSRTAPCKTFAGAISKTAVSGEINCLDPGGFGAVTITKSITIDCSTTVGGILASGTNGIVVNITAATDIPKAVRLRGLNINGVTTGINGVRILSANKVSVENTVIDGFTQHGISLETIGGSIKLNVEGSTVRNNASQGINSFLTGGATANISVANSYLDNNAGTGFNLSGGVKASINDTNIFGNGSGAVAVNSDLSLTRCTISHNTTGIQSSTGGIIRIFGNTVTGNATGLSSINGGSIISYSNNMVDGNTTNGSPTSFIPQS